MTLWENAVQEKIIISPRSFHKNSSAGRLKLFSRWTWRSPSIILIASWGMWVGGWGGPAWSSLWDLWRGGTGFWDLKVLGWKLTRSTGIFCGSVLGQDSYKPQSSTGEIQEIYDLWAVSVIWLKYCCKQCKTPQIKPKLGWEFLQFEWVIPINLTSVTIHWILKNSFFSVYLYKVISLVFQNTKSPNWYINYNSFF